MRTLLPIIVYDADEDHVTPEELQHLLDDGGHAGDESAAGAQYDAPELEPLVTRERD